MQANPTQESPNDRLNRVEQEILYLLTGMSGEQPIWSVEDLGREVEDNDDAEVSVKGLLRAGLINRTADGFVFATRAGVRVVQLTGHVVYGSATAPRRRLGRGAKCREPSPSPPRTQRPSMRRFRARPRDVQSPPPFPGARRRAAAV